MKNYDILMDTKRSFIAKAIAIFVAIALATSFFTIPSLAFADDEPDVTGSASSSVSGTIKPKEMMIVQWMKGYGSATSAKIKHITIAADASYSDQFPGNPTRKGYEFAGWSDPVESTAGDGQKVITITAKWVPPTLTDQTVNKLVRGVNRSAVLVTCAPNHHDDSYFDCYNEANKGDGINIHPGRISYGKVSVNNGTVTQNVTFLYEKYLKAYGTLKEYDHVAVAGQGNITINFIYMNDKWARNDGSTEPVKFVVACDKHEWSTYEGSEPNCIEDGAKTRYCTRKACATFNNGKVTETKTTPAIGHNFEGEWADNCASHDYADCSGHAKVCKNCNNTLEGGVQQEGHEYPVAWVLDKPATRDEAGFMYRTCVGCDHTITRVIPQLGIVSIYVQFVNEDGNVVKAEDPIELDSGRVYDVSDLMENIPEGYEANGETYGDEVSGIADTNKTINVPVKKIVAEQPIAPAPVPGTDNPTPETSEPTSDSVTAATPIAPVVAPAAAVPAAAPAAAPVANDEATIDDETNPLAGAPEEQVIADDENALAGFDDPYCWTHILMIIGALITIVYSACVIVRRRSFVKKFDDFEKEVVGEKSTAVSAQRDVAFNAYQAM